MYFTTEIEVFGGKGYRLTDQQRLVEQLPKSLCDVLDESIGIPQNIQPKNNHIDLKHELLPIVGDSLGLHLCRGKKDAPPLKES